MSDIAILEAPAPTAVDNITPIAAIILALTAKIEPLEAKLEVAKQELREAANPGTITVPGVGKVTLAAAVEGSTKTELVIDMAAYDRCTDEVKEWLRTTGLVVNKVTKSAARKSAVKASLNA